MSKGSGKRKCEDEISALEGNNPSKRLKVEDVIFCDIPDQETADKPIKNTVARRRYKLLTAIHLKKKYKYYCKKHDVTYLIESVRKEAKDSSKKRRDNFVQNFRNLSVSINFQKFKEDKVTCDPDEDIDVPNIDMKMTAENTDDYTVDATLSESDATPLRRYSTFSHLAFDDSDNENSNFKEHNGNSWTLPAEIREHFAAAAASFTERANFSDDDELDDDLPDDSCKSRRRKMKVLKCLTVRKISGTDQISFYETEDIIESGIEDDTCDGNADCDCSDHETLRRRFFNFEYESSSEPDNSDSFSDISEDN